MGTFIGYIIQEGPPKLIYKNLKLHVFFEQSVFLGLVYWTIFLELTADKGKACYSKLMFWKASILLTITMFIESVETVRPVQT